MRDCAVLNCTNKSGKSLSASDRVSFHLFPKDPETRQAWIYATGRLNWKPRQFSTICSEHFAEYDFTTKNDKRFLRSTTVPQFNLNKQNSRYSESQYHNETQAALEFLTGQMFPESQVPVQEESEVVTMQVIGGNNPHVVVKKPTTVPLNKSSTPEKKKGYFSTVNVFKSEAQLKAEKDKIDELIRNNLDPSVSKILLSLDEPPLKKKKKKNDENGSQEGSVKMPRVKNGQLTKSTKSTSIQDTSECHYETLPREEIIRQLKQKDKKITQQLLMIKNLQKTHLRDKVLIESLQIKLKLKNDQIREEPRSDVTFKKPAQQQIVTQKQQSIETTNLENHYQSSRNFPYQDQAYFGTQNRHFEVGLEKPATKYWDF